MLFHSSLIHLSSLKAVSRKCYEKLLKLNMNECAKNLRT